MSHLRILLPLLFGVFLIAIGANDSENGALSINNIQAIMTTEADAASTLQKGSDDGFRLLPENEAIDWEVDQLGRLRVILPPSLSRKHVSNEEIDQLLKNLESPKTFVAAHVVLTNLFHKPLSVGCASATSDGYQISYNGLDVRIRYRSNGVVDEKHVEYPDSPRFGSQQKHLASTWKDGIEWHRKTKQIRKARDAKTIPMSCEGWIDNTSYDIKNLSNERIRWHAQGFGEIHPILLKVHRDEITKKNIPLLLNQLADKSRFVAAHIGLSCVLGVDSFCVKFVPGGYDVHLNGLHVVFKYDENQVLRPIYPNLDMQHAWLQYRWKLLVATEGVESSKKWLFG